MTSWVNIALSTNSELSLGEIRSIIDETSRIAYAGQFDQLDKGLTMLNPHKMNADAIIAVTRSLYAMRENLDHYLEFLKAVKDTTIAKEIPDLLMGLL